MLGQKKSSSNSPGTFVQGNQKPPPWRFASKVFRGTSGRSGTKANMTSEAMAQLEQQATWGFGCLKVHTLEVFGGETPGETSCFFLLPF